MEEKFEDVEIGEVNSSDVEVWWNLEGTTTKKRGPLLRSKQIASEKK